MKKCDCKGYKSCLCNKELTIFKDLTEEEFNKLATGMTCFHFNKGNIYVMKVKSFRSYF